MKKIWLLFLLVGCCLVASIGMAADAVAVAPAPAQSIMAWASANSVLLSAFVVAVLSELMSLVPSLKSNGIIDMIIKILTPAKQ